MQKSIWTPLFILLLSFEVLCQFGTNIVTPITSNFAVALGATAAIGGLFAGLNSLTALFLRPFGGLVFGRFRRKPLLLVAAIVYAASSFVCAVFANVPVLGFTRIVMGAAFVIKSSLVVSITSSIVPREKMGQGVGWIGLGNIVANALGPGIGSIIGQNFGYHMSFVISGILFVVAIAILIPIRDPEERPAGDGDAAAEAAVPAKRHGVRALFHLPTIPFAAVLSLEGFVFGSITGLVLLTGEMRGIENMAVFFMVYAIVTFATRPIVSRLYDTYGLDKVIWPESVMFILSPLFLLLAHSLPLVIVSAVCLALGQGGIYPNMQAESVKQVSKEDTTLAVNTFYIGADLGMALGPAVSGAILQGFGVSVMYGVDVGFCIAFPVAYFCYSRFYKRGSKAKSAAGGITQEDRVQ